MSRLGLYILRWQLSTPILYACMALLPFGSLAKTVVANLIGALIFFPVDRIIMTRRTKDER